MSEQTPEAPTRASTFPTDAVERKHHPVASGVLDYFPDALVAVAHVSWTGNQQHNPGEPLHWAREKSTDEADALLRHFLQRGERDTDLIRHSAKMAWRALALLQKEIEAEQVQARVKKEFYGEPGQIVQRVLYRHTCGCLDTDRQGCRVHGTGFFAERGVLAGKGVHKW